MGFRSEIGTAENRSDADSKFGSAKYITVPLCPLIDDGGVAGENAGVVVLATAVMRLSVRTLSDKPPSGPGISWFPASGANLDNSSVRGTLRRKHWPK